MLPELVLDGCADAHAESSRALAGLLGQAVHAAAAASRFESRHAFGPHTFTVAANDPLAGKILTRYLVAAGSRSVGAPDLRIFVFSGSCPPFASPPAWNLPHSSTRHLERLHLAQDGSITAFHDHDRQFWIILDRAAATALFWIARTADIPVWEEAAPFRMLLHWFLADKPQAIVHGGVVATAGQGEPRGVLLAGPGGSGKSTTVAACLLAGFSVCGDDLVMLGRAEGGWKAHAIFDAVKLSAQSLSRLPRDFDGVPWRACGEKRLLRYSDAVAGGLARDSRLVALMQCAIVGGATTRIVPIPPSAMLRALGPPTLFLLRGREEATLAKVSRLVRELPCFRLELGEDPAGPSSVLGSWMEGTNR